MKRLSFSFLILIVLSFIIVQSCSSEEEDIIAPNVVQTPEPEPPAPTKYTLTVSAGEGGAVSTEGGTYDEGTEVTITAIPNEGYRFKGWEGDDSTSESLTITLNSNQTYQALFELIPPVQYTLTLTASEGGTVSSEGGTYEEGTVVSITAIPSEGYSFVEWTDPYGSTWGSSNLNVTMFENRSFQAVFELIPMVDFNFNYYIDNNSLPESWVTEFYTNQDYIRELLPINSYVDQFRGYKYIDGVDIYAWSSAAQRPSDFPDISGGCLCGFNDYESSSHIRMSLEVNNNEIENDDIHRHLLPIHEYFHAYQSYLRGFTFHGDYIWLTEGPAAIMEALFSQQQYGVDYWYTTREENIYSRISSENAYLFEKYSTSSGLEDEFGERYVINYASQVFLVLILSKEIQKTGYSEEQALRKIFVEFLENSPTNDNWKEIFQQVFGFSLEDFYLKINSYNINRENIIPSSNINLEDIFY